MDFSPLFDFVKLCLNLFDFVWITQLCTNFVLVLLLTHLLTYLPLQVPEELLLLKSTYITHKLDVRKYAWEHIFTCLLNILPSIIENAKFWIFSSWHRNYVLWKCWYNKLGLSWAKLSSSWQWALLQLYITND